MKRNKKVRRSFQAILSLNMITMLVNFSCVESKMVSAKTGVQLWGENCQRCHNTPAPAAFSAEQWETIGLHMQSRALLTENEKDKIVAFLKNAAK